MAAGYPVTAWVLIFGALVTKGDTATPVDRPVVEGNSVELRCDVPYDRSKDFHWVEKDYGVILRRFANADASDPQVLPPGLRGRVSLVGPDGVDLRIDDVRKADNGSYNCQQEGAENGTPQRLLVLAAVPPVPAAPTITGYSGEYLTPGSRLTLTCVSTGGNPPSDLTWYRENTPLTANYSSTPNDVGQGDATSVLTTPALQPSDNGAVYQCRASQLALDQVETDQVTLSVAYGPQNVQVTCDPSDPTDLWEGGDLECTCTADSNPAAQYSWMKGTEQLSSAVVDSMAGTLTYPNLHATQSGKYSCVAGNDVGSQTSRTISINVKVPMSPEAIAGIVLSSVLLVAVIGLVIAFVIHRKRSQMQAIQRQSSSEGRMRDEVTKVTETLASARGQVANFLEHMNFEVGKRLAEEQRQRREEIDHLHGRVEGMETDMANLMAERAAGSATEDESDNDDGRIEIEETGLVLFKKAAVPKRTLQGTAEAGTKSYQVKMNEGAESMGTNDLGPPLADAGASEGESRHRMPSLASRRTEYSNQPIQHPTRPDPDVDNEPEHPPQEDDASPLINAEGPSTETGQSDQNGTPEGPPSSHTGAD